MGIYTQSSLQKLFEASRRRQQQLKEQESKKYRKAQEAVKKALAKQQSNGQEKTPQKPQKQPQIEFSRTIHIYNVKYIERFADDDDLYQTREELEEAMPNNINWRLWDKLIQETKKMLNIDNEGEKTNQGVGIQRFPAC